MSYATMSEEELIAAFHENCSYIEDNDVAKAATFISVCRALATRPSSSAKGTFSASWNRQALLQMASEARLWLEARSEEHRPGPTVRKANLRHYRSR